MDVAQKTTICKLCWKSVVAKDDSTTDLFPNKKNKNQCLQQSILSSYSRIDFQLTSSLHFDEFWGKSG